MAEYEKLDLINKLFFIEAEAQGITGNPESAALINRFPNYKEDPLDAQAITAYLAITTGTSTAVTIAQPNNAVIGQGGLGEIVSPPIAFDFSHTDHRGVQALMWQRMLRITDGLIDLLKAKPFDTKTGESYWDRTLIYFATDFGRDKVRPANAIAFATGHHLNNASVILSPLVKGNTILGGVDYTTGETFGLDINTGAPDPTAQMREDIIYAGIFQALGVDTSKTKLKNVLAMKK